ncbi:unnamed protein product [Moneuplotes crassus]|uniref:EamA domain-containing protein n=1 Tax=Euplotes crassus TaxID=5936 RepID=A0AAD1XJ36_EUPCR|nr:unnamed protein product [Moneuplotes crassus]
MIYLQPPQDEFQASPNSLLISYDESMIVTQEQKKTFKSFEVVDFESANEGLYKTGEEVPHSNQNYMLGLTCAVLSSVCYASNIIFGKMALNRTPMLTPYDINFMRACTSLLVNSYQAKRNGFDPKGCKTKGFLLLILCNVMAALRSYPTVWSYQYISASKCLLIINTSPILVVIVAGILLAEKVTYVNYLIGLTAVFGCYILTLSNSADSVPNSNPVLGYTFALIACVARAGTSCTQRVLAHVWHFMALPFYYTFTLFGVSFIAWMFFEGLINVASYDLIDTVLLLLASLGTTFGMMTISIGLKHLPASTAAPITNLEVAFGFVADILIFHYQFYMSDVVGACIIFGSLLVHIALQCYKK